MNGCFFVCVASSLVWVAFASRALEGFLVASGNVTFRLQKTRTEGYFSCRLNEISIVKFRYVPTLKLVKNDGGSIISKMLLISSLKHLDL